MRPIGESDLALLGNSRGSKAPQIKKIRDRHHALARALASGYTDGQCSAMTGYDPSRISILKQDPTFIDLLEDYKRSADSVYADMHQRMSDLGNAAWAELHDRLEDEPEKFSEAMLLDVGKALADRTGYGPQQKNLNVNASLDMGKALDRARARLDKARVAAESAMVAAGPVAIEGSFRSVPGEEA